MSLSRQLHAASLPFVSRALRGGRKLRYAGVAAMMAVLSVLIGCWLALGSGELEHEMRIGFKLERPTYLREQMEFKMFAADPVELRELRAAAREMATPTGLRAIAHGNLQPAFSTEHFVQQRLVDALDLVHHFGRPGRVTSDPALQSAAVAFLARNDIEHVETERHWDRWSDAEVTEQVRIMLARDLVPEVTMYSSPLTAVDAVRVVGLVSGAIAMLLLLLFAPVLAGTQMAQEVHENTLQPLTGTALSARDLVLGMTLGPVAVITLLAAPQLLMFLAAAATVGNITPALGMIAVCLAAGAFLTMLAQLAGLALGRQRSSGMLGVTLLAVLAPLTMLGATLALELPARGVGVMALLPQGAASHLLLESFLPAGIHLRSPTLGSDALAAARMSIVLGALGMLCFAWLGLRALVRRIGESAPSALSRGEALLGAVVTVVLVTVANPYDPDSYHAGPNFYMLNLVLVLVPMAILLMMRVPMAEVPTALRRVPVGALMTELLVGLTIFVAVSLGAMGGAELEIASSPVAMFYGAWMIAVVGLLSIRVAALPMTLLAKIWTGVCSIGVAVAFVHAIELTNDPSYALDDILGFCAVSPLLGALQAVMLVLIPALLLRALLRPASTAPVED